VLGFMLATAFLSMWISNTATAVMMLPMAIAVGELFRPQDTEGPYEFGICLMLGIAYAASIGGLSTLVGTPPNAVLAGAALELLDFEIGFGQWMLVGVPVTLFMLPVAWFALTRVLYPPGKLAGDAAAILAAEKSQLGEMDAGERVVAVVFSLTCLSWVFRSPKSFGAVNIPGIQTFAPGVRDSTIAIAAALLLFIIPVSWDEGKFTLDWATAKKIPWGVLVLFGGGLSLALAMSESGLATWVGNGVALLGDVPLWVLAAVVATLFVFLTELTSNLATTTMAMPIMVGVAAALNVEPVVLMSIAALAASMAFMLPVATPPNAIVFGSGYLTIPQMARAGIAMNIIAIAIVALVGSVLVPIFIT
ncbi:MAG: DASS family sodium-coupled anion symporter, partial [Gemmatimonadota bacterium]|nr:DASS family sodium-coupled anion symporter [Gemmatimonadota bacterium]